MKIRDRFNTSLQPQHFLAPDDEEGGGSSAVDLLNAGEAGDADTTKTTPPAAAPFDVGAFAQQFGGVISQSIKDALPQQTQSQTPITPEEAKRILKVWEPGDDWFTQFGNLETQKQAVMAMRDGLTTQFWTILQHVLAERDQRNNQRWEPIDQFVQQQAGAQREAKFNGLYPQLADPNLIPLRDAVITKLVEDKAFVEKSEGDQFKAVAEGIAAVIKATNPNFKLNPATTGKRNQGTANSIPVTTPGAGGGGGASRSSANSATGRPKAVDLLS